jgi:hypothetical protein
MSNRKKDDDKKWTEREEEEEEPRWAWQGFQIKRVEGKEGWKEGYID